MERPERVRKYPVSDSAISKIEQHHRMNTMLNYNENALLWNLIYIRYNSHTVRPVMVVLCELDYVLKLR